MRTTMDTIRIQTRSGVLGAATLALAFAALSACDAASTLAQDASSTSGPTAPAESVANGSVLPSNLVFYLHAQNYLQPDWDQDDIASPLLPLARTEGLDEHERFFFGQLNFMAFEGDKAYEIFTDYVDRDDWYGYLARLRHEIMDARFYEDFEKLADAVNAAREDHPFKPEYANLIGVGEIFLCRYFRDEGQHDEAVAMVREIISKTPRDAAYRTLELTSYCYVSFKEAGQGNAAFELAQSVRDDLSQTFKVREDTADQHAVYDPGLFENQTDDNWYGRSQIAPYNYGSYLIAEMIKRIDVFLACNRDGDQSACPQ